MLHSWRTHPLTNTTTLTKGFMVQTRWSLRLSDSCGPLASAVCNAHPDGNLLRMSPLECSPLSLCTRVALCWRLIGASPGTMSLCLLVGTIPVCVVAKCRSRQGRAEAGCWSGSCLCKLRVPAPQAHLCTGSSGTGGVTWGKALLLPEPPSPHL